MSFAAHLERNSGRATPSLRRAPNAHHNENVNPAGFHLAEARSCSDKPSQLSPFGEYLAAISETGFSGAASIELEFPPDPKAMAAWVKEAYDSALALLRKRKCTPPEISFQQSL